MSENARPRRPYDSTKRRAQADHTRARIIDAAGRLFVERGYAGTTIPRIAVEAEVAVETVYRSASGKAGLLEAAVQAALAGGPARAKVPVEQRPAIRKVVEESDPLRKLQAYAATQPGVWKRAGPLLRVLDAAATTNESLEELRRQHGQQRLEGLRRLVGQLEESDALRADLSAEHATDLIWTICGRANYDALVISRGWAPEAYRDWLAQTLIHALLHGRARPPGD